MSQQRYRVVASALVLCSFLAVPLYAQTYNMAEYWLMPQGLVGNLQTVFWEGGTAVAQHSFWRGTLWGRSVALQGDPSTTRYDIFEETGTQIVYWGTFRGNQYAHGDDPLTQALDSHAFEAPFVWMDAQMAVGGVKQQAVTQVLMDHRLRKVASTSPFTLRVSVDQHWDNWTDSESGLTWSDVLKVSFYARYPEPASLETYYLARGLGTVRFETANSAEPSGVRYQYALSFQNVNPDPPVLPWLDIFKYTTFVPNGFAQDFLISPVNGGAIATYLRSWSGSSADVVISNDGGDPLGNSPWKIALRGSTAGGDTIADAASSAWIPATPNKAYKLGGYLWRSSGADHFYLDFNDGRGPTGDVEFTDVSIATTTVNDWSYVEGTVRVGPNTTSIKVRCVRDGANEGNGYCDGVTLYPLDVAGGGGGGGGAGFYPVQPCRLADTRNATGPAGGPALSANTSRSFQVGGLCGVPADAIGAALNITVANPGNTGWLRLYAAHLPLPPTASLSFTMGRNRANNTQIGLSPSGYVAVRCDMPSGTTHFVMDVYGYFK